MISGLMPRLWMLNRSGVGVEALYVVGVYSTNLESRTEGSLE